MNVKRKVEDMRSNLIVGLTLLLAACAPQAPSRPAAPAARPSAPTGGVNLVGEFNAVVQGSGHGLQAVFVGVPDAGDNAVNQNPIDTVELFSNANFAVTTNNTGGTCANAQTLGAAVTLKNYTLDELRNVHVQILFAGLNNKPCTASATKPAGSPATGGLGYYLYPNLTNATVSTIPGNAGKADNATAGQTVQWDFLAPSPGTSFVVRGQVYAERWPPVPVMANLVQDIYPATPTLTWTTDATVTQTLLDIFDAACATVATTYTVNASGSSGGLNTYSQAVPLPAATPICANLYPIAYAGLPGAFVGAQVDAEVLFNYEAPAAVSPADLASVPSPVTLSWTANPDAASVTAYTCPGTTLTPAACVSGGTPHAVTGNGTGNYSVPVTLAAGSYKWTLVASNYTASVGAMTGAPTALKSFSVK
jgi:hypothetical protein